MNKINNIRQILFKYSMLSLLFLLIGCSDKTTDEAMTLDDTNSVELTLDLSAAGIPLQTRGIGKETIFDADKVRILVFEELADKKEVYRGTGDIVENSTTKYTMKVKVARGEATAKYRIVVLTNTVRLDPNIKQGTSKDETLNNFDFLCNEQTVPGGSNGSGAIPMWGESKNTISLNNDKQLSIVLRLALARIDVGLKFKDQSIEQTEEVNGLDNFKLTSVRVYRTLNKAYVATTQEKIATAKPNIPSNAEYKLGAQTSSLDIKKANVNPLVYQIDLSQYRKGVDRLVGEIYIPESIDITAEVGMDEVPCLVIGGYYGEENIASNNPQETFYRLDFADYEPGGILVKNYNPILRNYRYTFDIKSVSNPGFLDPDQALNSLPGNMEVNLQAWGMKNLDFKMQGDYNFAIENREVEVPAADLGGTGLKPDAALLDPAVDYSEYVWTSVAYRTNVPQEDIIGKWLSPETPNRAFTMVVEPNKTDDNGLIWFGAKPNVAKTDDTEDRVLLKDEIIIQLLDMKFSIKVSQKPLNTIYVLDCSSVKLNGKYREGVPLNFSNNIEVILRTPTKLYSSVSNKDEIYSLKNLPVNVYTEKRKGIYFEFNGVVGEPLGGSPTSINGVQFNEYKIILEGRGTPVKDGNDPINPDSGGSKSAILPLEDLTIKTNSVRTFGDASIGSETCSIDIRFGFRTKRILTIGSNASYRFGYVLEPNSGSRTFVDASINFGLDPNSTVSIDQYPSTFEDASARNNAFQIKVMTRKDGIDAFYLINESELDHNLKNFKPDIILMGYATRFDDKVAEHIANYVDNGGVLIMFTEYYPESTSVKEFVNKIMGNKSFDGGNYTLSKSEQIFNLPRGDEHENDLILNGPFGDLRGSTWGSDGISLYKFDNFNLPSNEAKVYNTIGSSACFFHYYGPRGDNSGKPKAFVFNGDGGFLSNSKRYMGTNYAGLKRYFPFAIDTSYRPVARENYLGDVTEINNSKLFGNILAWAIQYAEYHGINRE